MPYAGASKKVVNVNSREAYRQDHHRNLFGTDKATPFDKKGDNAWQSTSSGSYVNGGNGQGMKAAGGVTYDDPNMQWMNKADRHTGVEY